MKHVTLGRTGLTVSQLSLGAWGWAGPAPKEIAVTDHGLVREIVMAQPAKRTAEGSTGASKEGGGNR
jgi:aryl-alcohol dehydrogenase-like predicted oxidoreductase